MAGPRLVAVVLLLVLVPSAAAQPRPSQVRLATAGVDAVPGEPVDVRVLRELYTGHPAWATLVAGPAEGFSEVRVNVTFAPGEIERRVTLVPGPADVPLRLVAPGPGVSLGEPSQGVLDVPEAAPSGDAQTNAPFVPVLAVLAAVLLWRRRGR